MGAETAQLALFMEAKEQPAFRRSLLPICPKCHEAVAKANKLTKQQGGLKRQKRASAAQSSPTAAATAGAGGNNNNGKQHFLQNHLTPDADIGILSDSSEEDRAEGRARQRRARGSSLFNKSKSP